MVHKKRDLVSSCSSSGSPFTIHLLVVCLGLAGTHCADETTGISGSDTSSDLDGGDMESGGTVSDIDTGGGADTETTTVTEDIDNDTSSDTSTANDTGTDADGGSGNGSLDGGVTCTPDFVDCSLFCGKLRDSCTKEIYDCGGCGDLALVCDVVTNLCVPPLVTCEDLEAECGTIRNSCGVRLECGYCESDEECDPDTNMCVPCTYPTCSDLGFQCGTQWNGCGSPTDTDDQIVCPECPDETPSCSPINNICEPNCTPDPAETICAEAELLRGVECGYISDGCGGMVNCGDDCPAGEECGVRGVANRCDEPERPLECVVLGWECGDLESACSGTQHCGDCPDDEVCNSNHICGPPCVPATCETAYAGQCGDRLADGCGGKIDCPCGSELTCNATTPGTTGTCEPLNNCNDYTTGEDGEPCSNAPHTQFPRGDGVNLECPCDPGRVCVDASGNILSQSDSETIGTCCTNTTPCDGTHCTATNSCTHEEESCCNPSTEWCDNGPDPGVCVARLQCDEIWFESVSPPPSSGYANGEVGAPCSNPGNRLFDDGSGDPSYRLACPCNSSLFCVGGDDPVNPGYCCQNENTCDDTILFDENCTIPNSCFPDDTDQNIGCCDRNHCCVDSVCEDPYECSDYTDGGVNDSCGSFERCDPGATNNPRGLSCSCQDSSLCCTPAPDRTCRPRPVCDGTCYVLNECSGDDSDEPDTDVGLYCCDADQYCGADECVDKATCATIEYGGENPDGDPGDPCSSDTDFNLPVGDGTYLSCDCETPSGWSNLTCTGDVGPNDMGTCTCTPDDSHCGNYLESDGCGGTHDFYCDTDSPEYVCDTTTIPPSCCAPYVCPTTAGGECDVEHHNCGSPKSCPCVAPYETCGGGGVAKKCGCTPETSCVGKSGTVEDGCGGTYVCAS